MNNNSSSGTSQDGNAEKKKKRFLRLINYWFYRNFLRKEFVAERPGFEKKPSRSKFWNDGYVIASKYSLIIPITLSVFFGLTGDVLGATLIIPAWILFLAVLYLFLAQRLGLDANSRTTWFTGVGENQIKFITDQSGQLIRILTPKSYTVTKEKKGEIDQGLLIKRLSDSRTWFGGLYFIGIPPFRRIFNYDWSWQKIKDLAKKDSVSEHKNELVDSLWIIQQQFMEFSNIETKSGVETLAVKIQVTLRVLYPKKVIFKNDRPGNWLVRLTTELSTKTLSFFKETADYAGAVARVTEYLEELKKLNGTEDAVDPKTRETFHKISKPGEGIAAIIGVMILDVTMIDIKSEVQEKLKEAQSQEQINEYELKAMVVKQKTLKTEQDAKNERITSKAKADAEATEAVLTAKANGLKKIVEAGGERIAISENLQNLAVLGEHPSAIIDLRNKKNVEEKDDEGGVK